MEREVIKTCKYERNTIIVLCSASISAVKNLNKNNIICDRTTTDTTKQSYLIAFILNQLLKIPEMANAHQNINSQLQILNSNKHTL